MSLVRYRAVVALLGCMLLIPQAQAFENNPLQGVHQQVLSDMETIEPLLFPHVEVLWRHTVMRSPTLQLALEKMAEKTGTVKPKRKRDWTQQMLRDMVQLGGMGGAVLTGSAAPLVGSSVIGRITAKDNPAKRLTEVTSADLVILAKEIEQAQQELLLTYYHYRQAQDEVAHLEASQQVLNTQLASMAESAHPFAETMTTLVMNQSLKLTQAKNTRDTYRNLLVLSAGLEGFQEAEAVDALSVVKSQQQSQTEAAAHDKPAQDPATDQPD